MKRWIMALFACLAWALLVPGISPWSSAPRGAEQPPSADSKEPGQAFRVLDIGERTFDGGPAVAVLFSAPLDATVRHGEHLRISDPEGMQKSAWVLSDDRRILYFPHVEPETEYSVTVLPSLTSAEGESLKERESRVVTTRQVTPIVSFASEGLLLPANLTDGLPVVTVNIEAVDIDFFRLKEEALVHFVDWKDPTGTKGYYQLGKAKEHGELVHTGRFDLDAPPNKRVTRFLPVEEIPALQPPGVYLAVMREPGEYDYSYHATYFLVTDIALHARIYKKESLIFASSLRTGNAVSGAEIEMVNKKGKVVHRGRTDGSGRLAYPGRLSGDAYLVKATHGGHVGVLPLNITALDMSDFDLGSRKQRPRELFLYSPRDLYRPGETVIVSGLLRDYDGRPIQSLPLTAKLFRADGKEVRSFTWYAGEPEGLNYYETRLDLPKDAQTGKWTLKVFDDPSAEKPFARIPFQVEEFLPERMKLDLTVQNRRPSPEEPVRIGVSGQYLYGAPAAGNRLSGKVLVRTKRDLFDRRKGFAFGEVGDKDYKDYWELEDRSLDKLGTAEIAIDSRWKEIKSPLSVYLIASLYETGGRPVTRTVESVVWPAETLVGIRPHFDEGNTDAGPVGFDVIKVDGDGDPVPADNLQVTLTKEDRDYYWEYSEAEGWRYQYTEKNYQFLADSIRLSGEGPTPYTLQLGNGRYVLAIQDPETGLATSVRFHVGRWWWGDRDGGSARPDQVTLALDRTAYRPGDIVRVTVTPPHDGEGLILVEGQKPLWFKRTPVSAEGTIVEIPVSAGWDSHDLYVSAVVLRPADAPEKITPNRAVGLTPLPLDRSSRKLAVSLEAPEKVAPQGPLTVTLKLAEPPADPVHVTLAAVDVGILNITDFETPDPFLGFFERRRFSVSAYDLYHKVIEMMDGEIARLRFGGDADLTGGKRPETKVELVSLFRGPTAFDPSGEARITIDIPDFNGRLRLMALAFSEDRFGSAESEVTVAAPVVTQLSTPRFLAPGDVTQFTLDIHNLSGKGAELRVDLTATDPLAVENGTRTVTLSDGEKTTLRFPVRTLKEPGASIIRLHLEGEGIRIARDWRLGVRPGYPALARKVRKILDEDRMFTLEEGLVRDMIPTTVEASMKISPVIPLNLDHLLRGLIGYPYGCLEQTTSRAFPLLAVDAERIRRYDLPKIDREERFRRLDKAVERLATMQLASGGFGLWNKTSPESTWLTVYVADFLLQARDGGIEIPAEMLDGVLKRLETYLKKGAPLAEPFGGGPEGSLETAARSYAAYVLARLGRAPLGALRTLYEGHKEQAASSLPLVHLGLALDLMGDRRLSEDALQAAVSVRRDDEKSYWGDYGSALRDLGLSLTLLIDARKTGIDGFDRLMLDLEEAVRGRRWLSTQEKYALFRAGVSLESLGDKEWRGKLIVAGEEQVLVKRGSHLFSPTVEEIGRGIVFISESSGFLYISAVVSGYTKTPPEPDESAISITREIFDPQGNRLTGVDHHVGDLAVVHLRIRSGRMIPDALVVDLLPAGFEIENQNLKHSIKLEDVKVGGEAIWRLKEASDLIHEEFRDDRYAAAARLYEGGTTHLFYLIRAVTPGVFSVPPPFVESMYRPEIRGIGRTPEPIKIINQPEPEA